MDDREFDRLASATLDRLAERLEEGLDDADVELREGVLTVELAGGAQYVFNRHAPNRELWMSSPISGAHHFAPAGGAWRSTRGEATLAGLVADELGIALD